MEVFFDIQNAAFAIRDLDELYGLAQLAAVGTRTEKQAAACLKRMLSRKRPRTKSAVKSAGTSVHAR